MVVSSKLQRERNSGLAVVAHVEVEEKTVDGCSVTYLNLYHEYVLTMCTGIQHRNASSTCPYEILKIL